LKILVVGGGAREHTLVWSLSRSPKVTELYAAPGNAGTAQIAHNLDINASDIEALTRAVGQYSIELVVVGPEGPLSEGIVDHFQKTGIPVFGSTKKATEIESSKVFSKGLMHKYSIPCADSVSFSAFDKARDYLLQQTPPIVVKADGLAAGKGVIVAETIPQATDALSQIMQEKKMGSAGDKTVIEEYLSGQEMSTFAFSDGQTVVPMASACDYKRIYDGDIGPNTGGMGSYSPPFFLNDALKQEVHEKIMSPAIKAMAQEGRPYTGVLYGGLMITGEGPKVIEFNARFGDPETQVILPRLKTDLLDIILAVIDGNLDTVEVECSDEACVGVVMASAGYPGSYQTGFPISGLNDVDKDILVFHAGTKIGNKPGQVLTGGGRVLSIVAMGTTIAEAREKVYANISRIHFEGCQYRNDIALIKENSN